MMPWLKQPNRVRFLLLLFSFISGSKAIAQSRSIAGSAVDAVTLKAIPFPVISVDGWPEEFLGDMEGRFSIPITEKKEIRVRVRAYQYLFADLVLKPGDSANARLYYAHPFTWQKYTSVQERQIIGNLLKNRRQINPEKEADYRYRSYNKTLITSANIIPVKLYLDNILRFFKYSELKMYSLDHHIFLMESGSDRLVRNQANQRETVLATQVSGISKPPAISFVSGFDAISVYGPHLRIGTQKYISPLAGRPLKRYIFTLIDSVRQKDDIIYVMKFNPKSTREKELLQGLLFISGKQTGVMAFHVWPSFDKESTFSLSQEAMLLPSGRWYPRVMRTSYTSEQLGFLRIPLQAVTKTWIQDFRPFENKNRQFDEIEFDFRESNLQSDSAFPDQWRAEPLSIKDQNTYTFFNLTGGLKGVDRFLNFGQKMFEGRFPAGKVDLVFRDAVKVNDYEGFRMGLGIETNTRYSSRYQTGGYLAYGFRDKAVKYGLHFQINQANENGFLLFRLRNDIAEPGIFPTLFDRQQYSSEDLRNIRISRFDAVQTIESGYKMRLMRNLNGYFSLEGGRRTFLYNYRFASLPEAKSIVVSELKTFLCWNPGERFARVEKMLYPVESGFPVCWLQYTRGIGGLTARSFHFNRWEARMQWSRKVLGLGDFGICLAAGTQNARVPYSYLFSARGSYRDFSFVSNNSFETMRYNEFFYNRFFQVFLSHRFGKMQISTLPFLPYFTLIHNMGWGSLANRELHLGIKVDDMPKGYFESGLFLNDLFVIPLSGVDLGVGAGLFLRYGPYHLPSQFDNLVLKFAANLGI